MADKIYNADEVTLTIAGALIDSGFGDGEFLRVEQESDDFLDVVGTDGEVAVSKSNDRRATITVILLQTSSGNDLLSALRTLAVSSPGLAGAGPLYIRDRNGRTVYESPACWIRKPPDATFDRSATSREWTIRCGTLIRTDGGNTNVTG
jgi:hypothetical protein